MIAENNGKYGRAFSHSEHKVTVDVDYILGLAAVVSDAAALIPLLWVIWQAPKLGAPRCAGLYGHERRKRICHWLHPYCGRCL